MTERSEGIGRLSPSGHGGTTRSGVAVVTERSEGIGRLSPSGHGGTTRSGVAT
jgi:hypothetical protein